MNLKTEKQIIKEINLLNFEGYNENISYCGMWCFNDLRTKLKIHKILPFNRFCFLHDKGYYLISKYFKELTFKEFLRLKNLIDQIFLKNMLEKANKTETYILKNYKKIIAKSFFKIVTFATPIYYFGFWWKSRK